MIKMTIKMTMVTAGLLALGAFAPPAEAQQLAGQYELISLTATNKQGVAVTNNVPVSGNVVNLTKNSQVTIYIAHELMASGTSTSLWEFVLGNSGTTNHATFGSGGGLIPIVLTQTGTTPAYFVTNLNIGAAGYLTLRRVGNNGTQIVTNIAVTASVKQTL